MESEVWDIERFPLRFDLYVFIWSNVNIERKKKRREGEETRERERMGKRKIRRQENHRRPPRSETGSPSVGRRENDDGKPDYRPGIGLSGNAVGEAAAPRESHWLPAAGRREPEDSEITATQRAQHSAETVGCQKRKGGAERRPMPSRRPAPTIWRQPIFGRAVSSTAFGGNAFFWVLAALSAFGDNFGIPLRPKNLKSSDL